MNSDRAIPWEVGSEFHWPSLTGRPDKPTLPRGSVLFASGRDALVALIVWGRRERAWRRWFVPSYFCPDVASTIAATGIDVVRYEDSPCRVAPAQPADRFAQGDVFFLVNYFGLRGADAANAVALGPAELVEDHTHDPWSDWAQSSQASFCLASLRKTLPVSDGAALWSPAGLALPAAPPITPAREDGALMKLSAMALKRLFLDGHPMDKRAFRRLQLEGEARIAGGAVSGISPWTAALLPALPWDAWRSRRAANYSLLSASLAELPGVSVLGSSSAGRAADSRPPGRPFDRIRSCPLAVVLCFEDSPQRDRVRTELIASSIYPAVHWPAPETGRAPTPDEALSRRLLSLPCDFRYGEADLVRVAGAVHHALDSNLQREATDARRVP